MGVGIDYGMGRTNVDKENGIRFGVISQHSVMQAWADCSEADYGDPTCPKCGNSIAADPVTVTELPQSSGKVLWQARVGDRVIAAGFETENAAREAGADWWEENSEQYGRGCADYACVPCGHTLDSSDCFGDEPQGFSYFGEGYDLTDCLDSDIMILKSEFYTRAVFCSPCVPGACSIESPDVDGERAYCLGHDWFEGGKAPYPVFRVSDDSPVMPD